MMKTENRHIEQAGNDTTAFTVIKNLLIVIAFGAIMDNIYPVRFFDTPIWCLISPLLFIAYLGYRVSTNRSVEAVAEVYDVSMILEEAEEAEARAVAKEAEANAKLNEANAKAIASEKIAIEVQTLRASEQTLVNKLQTLGNELANAKQLIEDAKQAHSDSLQTLKQSHEKATSALLTEKQDADKTANRLQKQLDSIKAEEEERAQRKSIKATWSASGKNEAVMAEKFAGIDWQGIVL